MVLVGLFGLYISVTGLRQLLYVPRTSLFRFLPSRNMEALFSESLL